MKRKRLTQTEMEIRNPVFRATITAALRQDLANLKSMAELQAWASAHTGNVVYLVSRLLWIVDHAAHLCRIPADTPEIRVIGGAANALGDLAARPQDLERHRPALQAGILAAERLWPRLDVFALGNAALRFEQALAGVGITSHSFHACKPKETA